VEEQMGTDPTESLAVELELLIDKYKDVVDPQVESARTALIVLRAELADGFAAMFLNDAVMPYVKREQGRLGALIAPKS
jgi:hypothetical protein